MIILLTSCAGYHQRRQVESKSATTENRQTRQLEAAGQYRSFNIMEHVVARDSLGYRALIRTDGPYRISTDSGIQGTGAEIWLGGALLRQHSTVKMHDGADSVVHQRVRDARHTSQQQTATSSSQRTGVRLNLYWLALPVVLVLLLWYLWKRW